jgi:hypothetical protein
MIKNEIAPGIVLYDNVISDSENLHLSIEEGMTSAGLLWVSAGVKGDDNDEGYINKKSRDTLTIGIPYSNQPKNDYSNLSETFFTTLSNMFLENFDPIEKDYKNAYGIRTDWHDTYGILKYGVGQKFTNHIDDHPDYHRRISTVYYINEDYEGGEIIFPRFDVSVKPKANQMIIFPSTYVYNHSVLPVTDGTRYAVVSWLK